MSRIANDNTGADHTAPADDNVVQPFQLELSGLRGRVVRVGDQLDAILAAHAYPAPVAHLLAEMLAMALCLSSMLKYEGVFTLQTSSSGPVRTCVVDVTSAGAMRAYASFDAEALSALKSEDAPGIYAGHALQALIGDGYLAFTVDQGASSERYQGIVALEGEDLSDCVAHYFAQSEQISTSLRLCAGYDGATGWRAGGVMIQRMPEAAADGGPDVALLHPEKAEERTEAWNRSAILLQSVSESELLAPQMHSHSLLFRLFHEEGVRVFPPLSVKKACRCSVEKVKNVLSTLSEDDKAHAQTGDGHIDMTCEFCNKTYRYDTATMACDELPQTSKT